MDTHLAPDLSAEEDLGQFRRTVRRFVEDRLVPRHDDWERAGIVPREVWREAGEAGLLLCGIPEEYGGMGGDFRHGAVIMEEMARAGTIGPGFHLHSDIAAPYILHYGSEEQKRDILPRMARGEVIAALALTEPGAGSDLQSIRTRAVADGNHYVLDGGKTFITNGQNADVVIVACKTDPAAKAKGISLMLVERGDEGFRRGRNLEKMGWHAQDTSELFFDSVRVPRTRLLGEEGQGFRYLMEQLPQERLLACVRGVGGIEGALERTIEYVRSRPAFGRRVADFQATRFRLAEIKTGAYVCRTLVDHLVRLHLRGELGLQEAAMGKLHVTETVFRLLDDCVQLHGGYGYMREYAVARAWADHRVSRIAGGTSEVMKEIIGRALV